MRRNRRNNAKKERTIMIASSVFVLAALTMTGIYMKSNKVEAPDDGYTIDFTQIENDVQDKLGEIAQNSQTELNQEDGVQGIWGTEGDDIFSDSPEDMTNMDDDLDYMPMEVGSGQIELPEWNQGMMKDPVLENPNYSPAGDKTVAENKPETGDKTVVNDMPETEPDADSEPAQEAVSDNAVTKSLHFAEGDGLARPLEGEVVIPFNTERTVYRYTLKCYRCNPALIIGAVEGSPVSACAAGRVIEVFSNEEIGNAVTMDIGDGYQITYGQLQGINVTPDSYVEAGDVIAAVAAPTKYYCVEGSNLYLKLTSGETPINPEPLFRQ